MGVELVAEWVCVAKAHPLSSLFFLSRLYVRTSIPKNPSESPFVSMNVPLIGNHTLEPFFGIHHLKIGRRVSLLRGIDCELV